MKRLVVIVAATMLLAGCTTSDGDMPEDDFALELDATESTGVIRGVVVDEAIRPIVDARITLMPGGLVTTTTENGAFGFQGLEPGQYSLTVNATRFIEASVDASVVANVDRPDVVKVQLVANPATTPYVQTLVFTGFIECSTTLVALCAVPNLVSEETGSDNITNDRFIQYFPIDAPDPLLMQSELVWESTQAASDQLWFWHSHASEEGIFNGSFEWEMGESPLLLQTNEEEIAAEFEEGGLDPRWQLVIRVFSGEVDGSTPPQCIVGFCGGPGFTLQQEFTSYTHLFYHFTPEDGWRFTDHGDPVVPA